MARLSYEHFSHLVEERQRALDAYVQSHQLYAQAYSQQIGGEAITNASHEPLAEGHLFESHNPVEDESELEDEGSTASDDVYRSSDQQGT